MIFKAKWTKDDIFNIPDYERIRTNLYELRGLALALYKSFELKAMPSLHIENIPYANFFNGVEENLQALYINTFTRVSYNIKHFKANDDIWSWRDLNRIENTMQQIYKDLTSQKVLRKNLSFILGGDNFV